MEIHICVPGEPGNEANGIGQQTGMCTSPVAPWEPGNEAMRGYGLSIHQTYSNISDAELDAIVSDAQHLFPGWGNRQMYGYLVSRGIRIQQIRVRESQS